MKRISSAIALIATLAVSSQATAASRIRISQQTAVNTCHGVLPSAENALRYRALGIANEGGNTVFVDCGLQSEALISPGIIDVIVIFSNKSATKVSVSCTLVSGISAFPGPKFVPKTFTLAPGSNQVGWLADQDNNGQLIRTPSISCAVPANVEINATMTVYEETDNPG